MPMPSLFKYFAFVGGALLAMITLASFLLDPATVTTTAATPAKPVIVVQHDPRASKIERWRNEQAALKAAAQTQTADNASLVTKSEQVRLVGVVTDRDIAIRAVAEGRTTDGPVSEIMSGGVKTCGPNDTIESAMELMGREQVRRLPIVDERGSLVGVVAQADLVRMAGKDKQAERVVEKISQPGGSHQT